ncbi:hypothetical protein N7466_007951 [Penicillium verhagenii]|uniref:uncharacterized protein n=1 Tax=Penicillium verhagenii TaxID=1562060 RepID=UPI00254518BF|nr:uncharacterized protein N7466_007951 [Penicillium verhagenii]KAJ5928995.1 hypothetical protein N7466_007951 [Penicillium verhagenii]
MPPRRAHTKSRSGCDQCKRRRVKCDETGPPCANCISRELDCTYVKASPKDVSSVGRRASALSILAKEKDPASPRSLAPGSPSSTSTSTVSGVRELELMHRFATDTYRTMSTSESEMQVWQIHVPHLALQFEFLMNGILALAALHIASTLDPPASFVYMDTALHYHNLTFAPFRASIDHLTEQNCEAVLAQSIITTVFGIALPRVSATRGESLNMTENIIVLFELLQGVKNIITIGQPWIKLDLYPHQKGIKSDVPALDSVTQNALDRLAMLNDETLSTIDKDQYRINKDVISHLHHCFTMYSNARGPANTLSWLAAVDKEFVDNVRRRQPLALLILMHWGVLLGELDGQWWWARNSGRALVSEILLILQPGSNQWADSLAWPRRKMGL